MAAASPTTTISAPRVTQRQATPAGFPLTGSTAGRSAVAVMSPAERALYKRALLQAVYLCAVRLVEREQAGVGMVPLD